MRRLTWLWNACLVILVLLMVPPVQAAPPAQDPQFDGAAVLPATPLKASVSGTVINWGYRSEPDLRVSLTGAGWMLEGITTNDGRFNFDNLGEGFAVINPILPEGSGLHAMTTDLAVPFAGPVNRVANVGIYGGDQPPTNLPVTIQMTPDKYQVGAGETISFTVTITNEMPNDIHAVFVTDMFPPELRPIDIESSVGAAWVGGQLAAASLGDLAEGEGAVVKIAAVADLNLDPNRIVTNRAGVFYGESVALQAETRLNDPSLEPEVLPETGGLQMGLPLGAAVVLLGTMFGLRRLRAARG